MAIILPKGSLATLASTDLSEHNRSELGIGFEILKTDNRTVSGVMRRYYVNNKRTFTLSWERLPALDSQTVDGKAGRNTIKGLYTANVNSTVAFVYKEVNISNNQVNINATVFIDSYDEELLKRYNSQLWNVTITLVEQ